MPAHACGCLRAAALRLARHIDATVVFVVCSLMEIEFSLVEWLSVQCAAVCSPCIVLMTDQINSKYTPLCDKNLFCVIVATFLVFTL